MQRFDAEDGRTMTAEWAENGVKLTAITGDSNPICLSNTKEADLQSGDNSGNGGLKRSPRKSGGGGPFGV